MRRFGQPFCWAMAALAAFVRDFDPHGSDGIYAILISIWIVGALVLAELSKWRKL